MTVCFAPMAVIHVDGYASQKRTFKVLLARHPDDLRLNMWLDLSPAKISTAAAIYLCRPMSLTGRAPLTRCIGRNSSSVWQLLCRDAWLGWMCQISIADYLLTEGVWRLTGEPKFGRLPSSRCTLKVSRAD